MSNYWRMPALGARRYSSPLRIPSSVIPPVVGGPSVASNNVLQVTLTGGSGFTSLIPQYSVVGSGIFTDKAAIPANSVNYAFTGLTPSTPYILQFKALGPTAFAVSNQVTASTTATPSPVPPTLSAPTFVGNLATVAFSGGSGYTTLIPQYATAPTGPWTSQASDTISPFTINLPNPSTLFYMRMLPDNDPTYASNIVSGTTPAGSGATLIFSHGYENGSLDPASGVIIGGGDRVGPPLVSTVRAKTGTHSMHMWFDESGGYELTTAVPSITIQFDEWIPVGYMSSRSGSANNKWIRVYSSVGYGSSEKVGASTTGQNPEDWNAEWGNPGGNGSAIGTQQPGNHGTLQCVTLADEGTWVNYKFYYNPPKAAGTKGTIKMYKNGLLLVDLTNTIDNFDPADTHNVKFFYLRGAQNSPYGPLDFFVDNLTVWSGEA